MLHDTFSFTSNACSVHLHGSCWILRVCVCRVFAPRYGYTCVLGATQYPAIFVHILSLNLTCILTHLREYFYILHSTSPILYKVTLYPFNKNSEWPYCFILFLPFQQLLRKKQLQPYLRTPKPTSNMSISVHVALLSGRSVDLTLSPDVTVRAVWGGQVAGRSHRIEVSWDWTWGFLSTLVSDLISWHYYIVSIAIFVRICEFFSWDKIRWKRNARRIGATTAFRGRVCVVNPAKWPQRVKGIPTFWAALTD